jgi:mono/diheme cytochrome c family protein
MPLAARISRTFTGLLHASLALVLFLSTTAASSQPDQALYDQGQKLFKGNCASCHKPDAKMTGPALKGAKAKWEGKGDIYEWVRNSQAYLKTGNAMATAIWEEYKPNIMTPMALSNEEIDAILYYTDNYAPPVKDGPKPPVAPGEPVDVPIWPWLLVLGLLFVVVAFSLSGVKKSLANAVQEVEGKEPIPDRTLGQSIRDWAWNNKGLATVIGLVLVVWVVLGLWDFAFNVGVYGGDAVAHYRPEQPIAFNHTLHAGKADQGNLAINCQYCHSFVEKSKHAGIPSTNVCMNCHKAVAQGRSEAGTAEIQKIYAAVGWDADKQAYTGQEEPVRWVKVHNLPDHVYFPHNVHVGVAKLECQECHGPIDEKMTVAEQWAPLTMGWCIQCHDQKEVKLAGTDNGYYQEVHRRLVENEKLGHRELKKYLEDDKITVKELGGWECAKCHY